jgi:hypothetical protein
MNAIGSLGHRLSRSPAVTEVAVARAAAIVARTHRMAGANGNGRRIDCMELSLVCYLLPSPPVFTLPTMACPPG